PRPSTTEAWQVNRDTADRCTILRGLVGSTVHGLNVNDGIEDRDEMGICVEPLEEAMALWAPFEQFIYRSAAEREGREDARSIAEDLDLTIYSRRKWMRLALRGGGASAARAANGSSADAENCWNVRARIRTRPVVCGAPTYAPTRTC